MTSKYTETHGTYVREHSTRDNKLGNVGFQTITYAYISRMRSSSTPVDTPVMPYGLPGKARPTFKPPKVYKTVTYRKLVWRKREIAPKLFVTRIQKKFRWTEISFDEILALRDGRIVRPDIVKVSRFKKKWRAKVLVSKRLIRVPLPAPKRRFERYLEWKVKTKLRRDWSILPPNYKAGKGTLPPTAHSAAWHKVRPGSFSTLVSPFGQGQSTITVNRAFDQALSDGVGGMYPLTNVTENGPIGTQRTMADYSEFRSNNPLYVPMVDPEFIVQELKIRAARRFHRKIGLQALNLQNYLSPEGLKSLSMFKEIVVRLAAGVKQMILGRPFDAALSLLGAGYRQKSIGRIASEHHLAFVYGLKPLMGDWESLRKLLTESFDLTYSVKASATTSKSIFQDDEEPYPSGYVGFNISKSFSGLWIWRAGFSARLRVTKPGVRLAAGLGFTSPWPTIWENIPFSFLVDWVVDVSDYLTQLESLAGVELVDGTASVLQKYGAIYGVEYHPTSSAYTVDHGSGATRATGAYSRVLLTELPPVPPPRLTSPYSVQHFVNAVALLVVLQKAWR